MRVGALLVLLACRPPAATPPSAQAPTHPAPPDCDGAQAQYEKVLAAQAEAMEGDARDQARTRVAAMNGITGQRCREDEWPAEIASCLRVAATDDEQRGCTLQMRADQHRRWFLQMMTGQLPTAATDDSVGPSCVQIEDNYQRLFPAGAAAAGKPAPDEKALAQRWVARILFERCLADGWPERARTCFGNASSPTAPCYELLPEPARTSLNDHLVDMAESLGVPY